MGLDMTLTKTIYIGGDYQHNKVTGSINILQDGKPIKVDLEKVTYIQEKAIYWRKANAIHSWFVSEVQDGEDECRPHDVSFKQLTELSTLCQRTIDQLQTVKMVQKEVPDHVHNSLKTMTVEMYDITPEELQISPTSGFFFGSSDIDEGFVKYLQHTIDSIAELDPTADYEYCSSW
jgi:hypothetical protein